MADDKSLFKQISELVDALSKRDESPETQQLLNSLKTLSQVAETLPTKEGETASLTDVLRAALIQQQRKAAVTGEVDPAAANMWVRTHWPEPRVCPVCKTDNWGLVTNFAHLSLGPPGLHMRTRTAPFVVITCRNCGNSLFFNALIMGQLPKGEE